MGFTIESLKLAVINEDSRKGEYKIGPLHKGYGVTIGNALRRVLLSSIEGTAVVAVHIDGIAHQFTAIPGVLEDGIQIVANIKQMVIKSDIKEKKVITCTKKGPGTIYAGDFICPGMVEIVNKDLPVINIVDPDTKLSLNFFIQKGVEYHLAEENRDPSYPIGTFPIDSSFCPVTHISFNVKPSMFNESLNYETLYLEIETNESISPMFALKSASKILVEYFSNITVEREIEEAPVIVQLETDEILKKPIEEVIPLSVRTGNVFKKAGIYTIQDLFSKSRKDLLSLKNFGMKSLSSTLEELLKVPDIEHLLSRDDLRLITEIKAGEISASSEDFDESDEDALERTPSKKMSDSDDETPVDEQPHDNVKDTILNMSIVDMCLELAISDSQLERLKKLQIDIVEHLTHLNKEDLLIGNNKLSKKNVDKIEEFLHQHGLKLKE